MEMGDRKKEGWSVFDGVKCFPPGPVPPPDALMAEVDAAIAAAEHAHSTAFLRSFATPERPDSPAEGASSASSLAAPPPPVTGGLADEAYRSACAALAAGKPDSALRSLRVALASCPPEKTSAISKLQSLFAFAISQQQRLIQQQKTSPS